MQSKENFNRYLPWNDCWVALSEQESSPEISKGMENLAESLAMQSSTLVSLLEKTSEGCWPVRLAGELFKASSITSGSGSRIITLQPSSPDETASLLKSITGEELFFLCSSDGKVLAQSDQTVPLFGKNGLLTAKFDSASSGAVHGALRKCVMEGRVPEFLVSHTEPSGNRSNYGITMRRLHLPGRLIFCRMQVPSVAVVTGTMDRNSLIKTILEESFCPNITLDQNGIIMSMNQVARDISLGLWGMDPTGSQFFDLVHQDQREAVKNRHEQRKRGYAVPSRYTIQLAGDAGGPVQSVDVSVIPIHGLDRWVVFLNPISDLTRSPGNDSADALLPSSLQALLEKDRIAPEEILLELTALTSSTAGAYVTETSIITAGDSRSLIKSLDRNQLAAAQTGFLDKNTFHQRINSGFGFSHLLLQGSFENELNMVEQKIIRIVSRILEVHHIRSILDHERKMLSLIKEIASAYLGRPENIDGLLADFTRVSSIETAVVFKISRSGNFLKSIAGAGTVGNLPDLPLDALNTASWACLRGETAFYTGSPENDLRFSSVFPESLSEIAVPFFRGTTPDGVVLLASTERDYFTSSSGDFIQLLALLFSTQEGLKIDAGGGESEDGSNPLKDLALSNMIDEMTGIQAAFAARLEFLKSESVKGEISEITLASALETAGLLELHSKWALWFLRTSLYRGKPSQKWIDPSPLLERVLLDLLKLTPAEDLELQFNPPPSDLEVCTDGSFMSMIAHSLLVCIIDNSPECRRIELSLGSKEDHWTFSIDSQGDSVPGECLSTQRQPDSRNMAFILAWKLTEELGGTVSTFSNRGKSTRIVVRLRISG